MFEQTIVTGGESRPWTYFVSASGQTLLAAVFVALPLIYTERMGIQTTPPPPLVFRPISEPAPVQPRTLTTSNPNRSSIRIFDPVFRAPVAIPINPPAMFDDPGPALASSPQVNSMPGQPTGVLQSVIQGTAQPPAYKKDRVVEKAPPPREPIKVSSGVQAAKLIKRVVPVYPPLARQARVSGTVRLLGVVAKDGTIQKLQLISGHPLLSGAALEAVRQWVYQPTLLNGEPVEVMAPIDVIFTLGQ